MICKAAPFGTVRSMFSLTLGLRVSGLSAGLCFSAGFASVFVEELLGGFNSCANVQPLQEHIRQIAPARRANFMATLPFSRSVLSQNRFDDAFSLHDRDVPIRGCHFTRQSCTTEFR